MPLPPLRLVTTWHEGRLRVTSDRRRSMFINQQELLHFSRRGARQGFFLDEPLLRRLESRELFATERSQGIRIDGCTHLGDDDRRDLLAPELIGQPDHGAVSDRFMAQQGLLNLAGMDVLTTRDDHVLLAAAYK